MNIKAAYFITCGFTLNQNVKKVIIDYNIHNILLNSIKKCKLIIFKDKSCLYKIIK